MHTKSKARRSLSVGRRCPLSAGMANSSSSAASDPRRRWRRASCSTSGTNAEYERLMSLAIADLVRDGVTHMAFGDLFLEDVRDYRIRQLHGTGIQPIFPIWASSEATSGVARQMIANGIRAVITCVDSEQLDPEFLGLE